MNAPRLRPGRDRWETREPLTTVEVWLLVSIGPVLVAAIGVALWAFHFLRSTP